MFFSIDKIQSIINEFAVNIWLISRKKTISGAVTRAGGLKKISFEERPSPVVSNKRRNAIMTRTARNESDHTPSERIIEASAHYFIRAVVCLCKTMGLFIRFRPLDFCIWSTANCAHRMIKKYAYYAALITTMPFMLFA